MKKIYQKMFVFAVVALGLLFGYSAHAMTPTLSLSSNNNNYVTVTVNGDSNSSVYLYYNLSYGNQNTYLGTTNGYGYFSTTLEQNSYNMTSGSMVYVTVNGQSSQTYVWPTNYNNCSNCYTTSNSTPLTISSLTLPVGSSAVLNSTNGQSMTVNSNSNGSVVTTSGSLGGGILPAGCTGGQYSYINGQPCYTNYNYNTSYNSGTLQLNAISVGTSNLTICSNYNNYNTGYNNNCMNLTVTVTGASLAYNNNYNYTNTGAVLGACYFNSTLRFGMTGSDVLCLQSALQTLGYLPSGYTSQVFDSTTLSAVTSFQRARGLFADGIVGRNTRNQLLNYSY